MEPFGEDVARSFKRSRKREEAIVMLSSMSEAYPSALAHAIGVNVTRLHEIMQGHPERYSVEDSPLALRLAELRTTPRGRAYVITNRGRAKARQVTSRQVRAHVAKQARADWARGVRARQVDALLSSADATSERPPVPTLAPSSVTVTLPPPQPLSARPPVAPPWPASARP